MANTRNISTLFLDIGGVLLTNGWDRNSRKRAAEKFGLAFSEFDERHHLTFDTYEVGELSLDEYLNRVVFYQKRPFTPESFKDFMYRCSHPFPEMIDLIRRLKMKYNLKTVAVSNEGRELTLHRIREFQLQEVIDSFISSCFVHLRKPDMAIYRLALDISQAPQEEVLYLDDRSMFVDVAKGLGIRSFQHVDIDSTREALSKLGLD